MFTKPTPLILVVDREPGMRNTSAHVLCAAGYRVFATADVEAARCRAAVERPGLILVEFSVGPAVTLSGLFYLLATPETAYVPIIAVTAETTARACTAAHRYGAVDVLIKPAEPEILLSFVRRHLPGRIRRPIGQH